MVRVFLDFDGVLGNMSHSLDDWAWKNYRKQPKSTPQWGIAEALGVPHHKEADIWNYVWREYSQLYPGAEELLWHLPDAEIVSNRPSGPARENFNGQFRLRLGMGRKVHLFENWEQKERFIMYEAPDALLEDNLEFLVKFPESETRLFLLDRAWNQSADVSGHYTRVKSYSEFLSAL